jgi:hypothetical protein
MSQPTFRPRIWTPSTPLPSPPPSLLPKFDSMYDLKVELAGMHPFELLDYAAKTIAEAGPVERRVRSALFASGYFETSLLYKAMGWLVDRRPPEALLDPDTPPWLFDVNDGVIRAAKRRVDDDSTSYLLELKLPGGPVGSLQVRVDTASGAITNYYVAGEPMAALVKLIRSVEPEGFGIYRKIATATAYETVLDASVEFDVEPIRSSPGNPWPHNRALLDFVLDEFDVM